MKKIFIGSSSGAKKKANFVRRILQELGAESVVCWFDPGVFIPGDSTLDNLLKLTRECNGAVFIFDKDDELVDASGTKRFVTRDNVILEAGLFIGSLGKNAVVLCHVPGAHILSDYNGVTHLSYEPDDPDRMREVLRGWLVQRVRGDRAPKSENNIFMESRKIIHRRYSLTDEFHLDKDGFSHIQKIRIMNMAGNLVTGSEYTDPAHELPGIKLSQIIRCVLEKTNATLDLMLLDPNERNLRDAAARMPNPNAKSPEQLIYASWRTICENIDSDNVYRSAYQSKRFRCFASMIGMPYAILGVEYDEEYAQYNHVKIDLYSSGLGDEGQRRSFIVWQDTNPQNYDFFIHNFDNIRGNPSACHPIRYIQRDADEINDRIKLSEIERELQKNPLDSALLISKAVLLYGQDRRNYSQAVQTLLSAMYFSPGCFEAYDKLVEIAIEEKDPQRILKWLSGPASLTIPEGFEHTWTEAVAAADSAVAEKNKQPEIVTSKPFEIASMHYKCILQFYPSHEQALLKYGSLLRCYEQWDDALKIFERLATLFPKAFYYSLCARTCVNTNSSTYRLEEFCLKGLKCPDDGFHQDLLKPLSPETKRQLKDAAFIKKLDRPAVSVAPEDIKLQGEHEKIVGKLLGRYHSLDTCNRMGGFTKDCTNMLTHMMESPAGIMNSAERVIVLEMVEPDSERLSVTVTKYFDYIHVDQPHDFYTSFWATEMQAKTYRKISLKIDGEDYTTRLHIEVADAKPRGQLPYHVKSNRIPLQNPQCRIEYTATYECVASDFFQSTRLSNLCRQFKVDIFLGESVKREYELLCATFSPFSRIHYDDCKAGELSKPYTERILLPRWSPPGSGYVITLKKRSTSKISNDR